MKLFNMAQNNRKKVKLEPNKTGNIESLNYDVLLNIFKFFNQEELKRLRLVSKTFQQLSEATYQHKTAQWKKWVGKVCGSNQEIRDALVTLDNEPKDAKELQMKIFEQGRIELGKILEEAEKGYQYCPY